MLNSHHFLFPWRPGYVRGTECRMASDGQNAVVLTGRESSIVTKGKNQRLDLGPDMNRHDMIPAA